MHVTQNLLSFLSDLSQSLGEVPNPLLTTLIQDRLCCSCPLSLVCPALFLFYCKNVTVLYFILPKADHSISALTQHEKQLHWHIFNLANKDVVALWNACEKAAKNKKLAEYSVQNHIIKCQRAVISAGWAELVLLFFIFFLISHSSLCLCKNTHISPH